MSDYEKKINDLKNELKSFETRMETISKKFFDETAQFLTSWYEEKARDEIKRNSEVTNKIGKDQLAFLKKKLRDLQEKVKDVVTEFLGKEDLWWHKSHGEQQYSFHGYSPPDIFRKGLRLAAGQLAPIMEEFGYFSKDDPEHYFWRDRDFKGIIPIESNQPYYPFMIEWSPAINNSIADYNEAHMSCQKILEDIKRLEKEKSQKQAEDLWDSV